MDEAIYHGFLKPEPGYLLRDYYGLTDEANVLVTEAIAEFIAAANAAAMREGIDTFHKRLDAFQDSDVHTEHNSYYDDYFGWSEPAWFDSDGNDLR